MYTNLRNRIHNLFSRFIIRVYLLARSMHRGHVLPDLEKLARNAGLLPGKDVTVNAVALNGGPLYSLGCSPTAAGELARTDEGSNFPNSYPGTLPPDSSWRTFEDNKDNTYSVHPLIATELTLEQRWDFYQSTAQDPVSGGTDEDRGDAVGPFMRSSVHDLGDIDFDGNPDHNQDGDTTFFTYGSSPLP
jgi:hypothetical protein